MFAEVVIHLGSEWRDVAIYIAGLAMGIILRWAHIEEKTRKHPNK
jgi:hypothetical protein